ncbi:uncharacterized protein LOC62_02G002407 [Vanrija pseudolonga]|uniref:Uncharacterized protein n=1 Tax=Vanrija pseudolonga TaxID=143232 RepID=A0AAF1BIL1_9TREE|nr:hypothetical protein LOC62_02G002407 [Vanrija pseudolonga]
MSSPEATSAPTKERGPVEELISRRLKPLNKKILRFRGYADKPAETLNADQVAGLAALPQLEAASRELEELSRQVEDAELVAAAKTREVREAAERDLEDRVTARVRDHTLSIASQVAAFLKLHSLLHPARPNDHTNLTFAPLTLPYALQDQVLATDILRVGRMYDDLLAGGEAGHDVLSGLVAPRTGLDDDEGASVRVCRPANHVPDDRVRSLLVLLGEPGEPADPTEVGSTAVEAAESTRDFASEILSDDVEFDPHRTPQVHTRTFDFDEPAVVAPHLANFSRGAALNFLQEDELEVVTEQAVHVEYEVVEPIEREEMDEPAESLATTPTATSTPFTPLDWTAEDETTDDHDAAEQLRAAFAGADGVAVITQQIETVVVTEAVAAGTSGTSSPAPNGEKKKQQNRKPSQQRNKQQNGDGKKREKGDKADKGEKADKGDKAAGNKDGEGSQPRKERAQGKGRPRQPKEQAQAADQAVDSDGFETVRRSVSTPRGRGGAARGARGGGRGGAHGGQPRTNGQAKDGQPRPRKDDKGNGKPAGDAAAAATPKPKPSIYKTTQPAAPTSAPIF